MPSYVTVGEAIVIIEQMADQQHDMAHRGRCERHLSQEEALDKACRLLDLFGNPGHWSTSCAS